MKTNCSGTILEQDAIKYQPELNQPTNHCYWRKC